jgi:lysophospholipase L1-like esterase
MTQFSRRSLIAGSLGASLALPSIARAIEGCGEQPNTAPALQPPRLLTDWAWLGRYRQANAELMASGAKVDAVFLGDSITEGWASTDPGFFAGANIGRGISAQTTPQLLVRIMAGTNDIAQNTGPMSTEDSKNNFMAMCEIARAHKIRVVLGSVPPASKYWWRPDLQPKAAAIELNEWMRAYAREIGAVYADYSAALTDADGNVKLSLAKDEVHPTPEGYAAMRPIAAAAISKKR